MVDPSPPDASTLMAIDVHSHLMPLPLLEELELRGLADLDQLSSGVIRLETEISGISTDAAIPCPPAQYDLEARLEYMERTQVDIQVLSAPPFLFASTAEADDLAVDVVRRSNDSLSRFVAEAPEQFTGLGTVPVGRRGAAEEARRCIEGLGLAGVTMGTFGAGRELDDPVNEELWAYLAEVQAFAFLHPSRVSGLDRLDSYHLPQLLGYPAETALAASRLIFGGVLDRHDLNICLAHGGGCLPILIGRLDLGWERKEVSRTAASRPSSYLSRFYFDTAVFSPSILRRLIEDVGADRVLLGTDAPFDLADTDPRQTVSAADLTMEDMRAVLAGNIGQLLAVGSQAPWPVTPSAAP